MYTRIRPVRTSVAGSATPQPRCWASSLLSPSFDVIQHYALTVNEPTYDIAFDRGPQIGPNVWNMTAPDGVIDLSNDIFGVIQQY